MATKLPTKAEFLAAVNGFKDLQFKLSLEDSVGQPPRVSTADDGSLFLGDLRLASSKDAVTTITRLAAWFGLKQSDLPDVPA